MKIIKFIKGVHMKDNRILGLFLILSATGFIITGITHFLMPPEQLHFARNITSDFFISLSKNDIDSVVTR